MIYSDKPRAVFPPWWSEKTEQ